jgi:hypothetical protein
MKNVAQRLIGSVVMLLLLGSAAGCQFGSSVEMEEVQGPVVRVHGTKPETIAPRLMVTYQATKNIEKCQTRQLTGYVVPHRRQLTVWPGDRIENGYSTAPGDIERTTDMSIKEGSCDSAKEGEACQEFVFESSLSMAFRNDCEYNIRDLAIGLSYTGPERKVNIDNARSQKIEYGYGVGSVIVVFENVGSHITGQYGELPDTVEVDCKWGGFEHSNTDRPLECQYGELWSAGYSVDSIPSDSITINVNVNIR